MLRIFLFLLILSQAHLAFSQQGDEMVVYAVRGTVTSLYKNAETPVKAGKVLLPAMLIRARENASLTLLCSKGKSFLVRVRGDLPVSGWKDSCNIPDKTISGNYFRYIWGQLYTYSPEHKEEMRKRNEMAVSRGEPVPPGKKKAKIQFSRGMDTICYDGRSFPLSWDLPEFRGIYIFKLFDVTGGRLLFSDSLVQNYISIDSIRQFLVPGNSYRWIVSAGKAPVSGKKTIWVKSREESDLVTDSCFAPLSFPEDPAARSFRTAFMLEQKHFLAGAYEWYRKASEEDPENRLYLDQLIRFRNEFWIR
ncbi:MAG: hypothetical protein ACO25B_11785 [Chitinophagaceae bacterium]